MSRVLGVLVLWYLKVRSLYHCEILHFVPKGLPLVVQNRPSPSRSGGRKLHRYLPQAIFLLLGLALSGCGEGQGPDWLNFSKPQSTKKAPAPMVEQVEGTVLASINGRIITLEDFNARIQAYNNEIQASKDVPDSVKPNYLIKNTEDKKRLLDGMVERELLIGEALERGLDQDKELVQAVKALKEQLIFTKIIEDERTQESVTAQEVENYYNLYKDAFIIPEERKISVIVVPSEPKAKEILIALLQGGDFGTLARANSTDPNASSGGDIGFIVRKTPFPQPNKKTMFKNLEDVAFALELNKPSTIFSGPNGFYLIKITEIKKSSQRLLSDVYKDVEQGLLLQKQDQAIKDLIGNLRKSSTVVLHEELL